jgi:hypothetical protein
MSAGEREDAPMIVTAADPNDDPMTRATRQMAVAVGGDPVVQYQPGAITFSGHNKVIYLGHGEPGGELVGVIASQLIADLTDSKLGLSPGTEMMFWSCYAAAGPSESDSLLRKVHDALQEKKISKVRVSGIPGALYTNINDGSLYSGPTKTAKDKRPEQLDVITSIEVDVWLGTGLCVLPKNVTPTIKTVKIGDTEYQYQERKLVFPPRTTEAALNNLKDNKKLLEIPRGANEQEEAIANAMKAWYNDFFSRPITKAYMKTGTIARWDQVEVSYETA